MLAMFSIGPMELILVLFTLVLMVGVLTLLPFGIVIVLFIVALSDWPALKQKSRGLD
jgi:ABC-type dipeptide/oligopeptide/nickel transport system permease subunit